MCEKRAEGRKIGEFEEETFAARVCNDGGCRGGAQCLRRGGCGLGGFNRGMGGTYCRQREVETDLLKQIESRLKGLGCVVWVCLGGACVV